MASAVSPTSLARTAPAPAASPVLAKTDVKGRARSFWASVRNRKPGTAGALQRSNSAAMAAAAARASATDTLGTIFGKSMGPGVAAAAMGAIDNTEIGKQFTALTGDWIAPSTALTILGSAARGLGVDRKYLGKHITGGNTRLLTGMMPVLMYKAGASLPDALSNRKVQKAPKDNESAPPPPQELEPIPGELTVA